LIIIFDFTFTVVIDYYLMQNKQFFTYLGENKLQFDEMMFVLYETNTLSFYSASSLKQKSAPPGHIILFPSQPVCFCSLMLHA